MIDELDKMLEENRKLNSAMDSAFSMLMEKIVDVQDKAVGESLLLVSSFVVAMKKQQNVESAAVMMSLKANHDAMLELNNSIVNANPPISLPENNHV